MSHHENRIESLTRKWWVLHKEQRATYGVSEWARLEEEKDEVVEFLAAFGAYAPQFPLESQE